MAEIARAAELATAGRSYEQIAAEVGRSPGGIGLLLNRLIRAGRLKPRGILTAPPAPDRPFTAVDPSMEAA
ncbi:MAG: hypothetical protein WDN25_03810 [Acetobacteraceae bacterium]